MHRTTLAGSARAATLGEAGPSLRGYLLRIFRVRACVFVFVFSERGDRGPNVPRPFLQNAEWSRFRHAAQRSFKAAGRPPSRLGSVT